MEEKYNELIIYYESLIGKQNTLKLKLVEINNARYIILKSNIGKVLLTSLLLLISLPYIFPLVFPLSIIIPLIITLVGGVGFNFTLNQLSKSERNLIKTENKILMEYNKLTLEISETNSKINHFYVDEIKNEETVIIDRSKTAKNKIRSFTFNSKDIG